MSNMQLKSNDIEELRLKLYQAANGKSLADTEVLCASQLLDKVITDYQKLMNKKTVNS